MVEPTVEGLRARTGPSTGADVLSEIPVSAYGMVEQGPLPNDGHDWYLVTYAYLNSSGLTSGGSGWIAAGSPESPWLRPSDAELWSSGFLAGYFGPGATDTIQLDVPVPLANEVRWGATGSGCDLEVSVATPSGALVMPTQTVNGYATGTLDGIPPEAINAGTLTVYVNTACAWAIAVVAYIG